MNRVSTRPKSKAQQAEGVAPDAAAFKTPVTKPARTKSAAPRRAAADPPPAVRKAAASPRRMATSETVPTAQVIPLPERPATRVLHRRRGNRRSERTIEKILACTEAIVLESGAKRISILDVCRAAGISRGTFYRYFASQDELLDSFSRHKRERFHRALQTLVAQHTEADARFASIIAFLDNYLQSSNARRLLEAAPEYALGFFKRIFHDSVVRFQDALGIVFESWERQLGVRLDRELVAEMLIRYVLSELLVPSDGDRKAIPRRIGRMVDALLTGAPARTRR